MSERIAAVRHWRSLYSPDPTMNSPLPPDANEAHIPLQDSVSFRRLVETVEDYAIFMLTVDGRVATWNAGAELIKGYSATEIIGRHFSTFYPAEALAAGLPAHELERAAAAGRFEDEGWRLRKDGTRFWANVIITALRSPDGDLLGYSKITRDLTARREHEDRLRQSEESLRLLIEGVADYAIYRLDPEGRVVSWNTGARRIKGYSADEIIGRHFSCFYRQEDIQRGWPAHELEVAARLGRFEDEGWRVRKDGALIWANVIITAIRDSVGTLRGYSKITRDLTERRRHEDALREREENLRLLVEGVKDHAIFMLSTEGTVVGWNAGAARVYGYSDDDIVGRNFGALYVAEDRVAGQPQRDLATAHQTGAAATTGWRARRDGSRFWADVTLTAMHRRDGALRGFANITRDVTERRRMRELETEGKRIEEFIAMLAHELRNPLAPIRNAVGVLGMPASSSKQRQWCAQVIGRQVDHLSRLVDDLLDVSRITSGKIQVRREEVELDGNVVAAVDSLRPVLASHRQTVQVSTSGAPLTVVGDATRLTQVVVNLVSNAAKYTPDGGRIEVRLEAHGSNAVLEVADDGIGMSASLMQTAFDMFVQGQQLSGRTDGGLGIGLPLVKRIVELHGGTVSASSAGVGLGTTMTVTLPLATAQTATEVQGGAGPCDAQAT